MEEAYTVKFSYQRANGSLVENKEEIFVVKIGNSRQRGSYQMARGAAKEKYGKTTIVHSVTYYV